MWLPPETIKDAIVRNVEILDADAKCNDQVPVICYDLVELLFVLCINSLRFHLRQAFPANRILCGCPFDQFKRSIHFLSLLLPFQEFWLIYLNLYGMTTT